MGRTSRLERAQYGVILEDIRPYPATAAKPTPSSMKKAKERRAGRTAQIKVNRLTTRERITLLQGLQQAIEGGYAHLPLKQTRYGFDPVQRLRFLENAAPGLTAAEFNFEVTDIITRLRDAHTYYTRPESETRIAVLPFMIEMYYDGRSRPRYIVSHIGKAIPGDDFKPGVELVTWSGVPIDVAVQRHSDRESGGRPDTQRALSLSSMTMRALRYADMPDEDWVHIEYREVDKRGEPTRRLNAVTLSWHVVDTAEADRARGFSERRSREPGSLVMAVNPAAQAVARAKALLFAPSALSGKSPPLPGGPKSGTGVQIKRVETRLKSVLRVSEVDGPGGPYAYLRIFSFDPGSRGHAPFVRELRDFLPRLTQRGIIIDVRSNGGGYIDAAERVLQFFTPRQIEPTRFSMRATEFTRALCEARNARAYGLLPWLEPIREAIRNGEPYSSAIPLTNPEFCNNIGQIYGGPSVLVADALTYSAGDLFCAGFVDNGIGPLVCVSQATGAGGANVWEYTWLRELARGTRFALPRLPDGTDLSMSFRRATRARQSDGALIEDIGIAAQHVYPMSRADLTQANRDLLKYCIGLLRRQPFSGLSVGVDWSQRHVKVTTEGIDRLDAAIDGVTTRTRFPVANSRCTITFPRGTQQIELTGFHAGRLAQRRLLRRPPR